ncbi:hypothetical protein SELMODRAFT_415441 [Selaginella moellendorffii]|uniref:Uncharacterized protein n=1 Tax=Selaginella moellendorffii TaxID=88036 RepID=D8RW48_SELML|nr:hypothetical protein SELMODRAFT_415441 [Selaginella moellendorffii]
MTIYELVALSMQITLPPNFKNIPYRYVLVEVLLEVLQLNILASRTTSCVASRSVNSKNKFQEFFGFLNCYGAIDYTYFKIELPGNTFASDYYNKDKDKSIVMQAIIDSEASLKRPILVLGIYHRRLRILRASVIRPFPSVNGTKLREAFNFYFSSLRMGFNSEISIQGLKAGAAGNLAESRERGAMMSLESQLLPVLV